MSDFVPEDPPTPSTSGNWTRRKAIRIAGFAGVGFVAVVLGKSLFVFESFQSCPSINSSKQSASPGERTVARQSVEMKTFQFEVVTVDKSGEIINRRPGQANFFVENLGDGITLEMVEIPGGCYVRGPTAWESFNADGIPSGEGPRRRVTVPSFFMGKFAVTQAQYKAVMGKHRSHFKGANRPVEMVSWYNAMEFCSRLTQKTGRVYRLPSEAEWEFACRAGTETKFHFGEVITTDLANYNGDTTAPPYHTVPRGQYRQQTTDVGSFPPNGFGLYDMHGNVMEWCADHRRSYKYAPTDGSPSLSDNPNEDRIVRGGSWDDYPGGCTSAERSQRSPDHRNWNCGFRVVAVLAKSV